MSNLIIIILTETINISEFVNAKSVQFHCNPAPSTHIYCALCLLCFIIFKKTKTTIEYIFFRFCCSTRNNSQHKHGYIIVVIIYYFNDYSSFIPVNTTAQIHSVADRKRMKFESSARKKACSNLNLLLLLFQMMIIIEIMKREILFSYDLSTFLFSYYHHYHYY